MKLSNWKIDKAKQLARELALDGMIWGKELEKYIDAEIYNKFLRLNDVEKEIFIDVMLDWVQASYDRVIVIYDRHENKSTIYMSMEDAAREINTTGAVILNGIRTSIPFLKKRYEACNYNPKIKEINAGLLKLNGTIISGRINDEKKKERKSSTWL